MKAAIAKKTHLRFTTYVFVVLCWLPLSYVSAVNIKVGGAPPLDLSNFKTIKQETFDSNKSQQTIFGKTLGVDPNTQPPWSGALTNDFYTLTNTSKPGAVRYYYRQQVDETSSQTMSENAISVEISGDMNDPNSGAGLLYAFDPENKNYLAFVKGPQNSYALFKRNAEGLKKLIGGTTTATKQHKSNQLTIIPEGHIIHFYINASHITTIDNGIPPSGGAGILAMSSGRFIFDNFTLYKSAGKEKLTDPPAREVENQQEKKTPVLQTQNNKQAEITKQAPPLTEKEKTIKSNKSTLLSLSDVLKTGMSKDQVVQALGKPAYIRGPHFFYNLDQNRSETLKTLVVQFDDKDTVLDHKTIVQ